VAHQRTPSFLRWSCFAATFAGFLVVVACGSNSPSSSQEGHEAGAVEGGARADAGAYTFTNCPSQSIASAACSSCLEKSCGTDLSDVNTACADYYACLCPSGSNVSACSPSAACTSALIAIDDNCSSCDVCATPAPDAGGYTLASCPAAAGVLQACVSCLQASCATELSAIDTACATFLDCACPTGANAAACTASDGCELQLATSLLECTACETECVAPATDGGPADAESDVSEPVDSGSADTAAPGDAGPDATVTATDASPPLEAGRDGGDAAIAPGDSGPEAGEAGADALAPADATTGGSGDAVAPDAGPEAAAPTDAETDESDDGATSDG
jgi:hypothetical protein